MNLNKSITLCVKYTMKKKEKNNTEYTGCNQIIIFLFKSSLVSLETIFPQRKC